MPRNLKPAEIIADLSQSALELADIILAPEDLADPHMGPLLAAIPEDPAAALAYAKMKLGTIRKRNPKAFITGPIKPLLAAEAVTG